MKHLSTEYIIWDNIKIEIITEQWPCDIIGFQIRSIEPKDMALPITKTGFTTAYVYKDRIAEYGSASDYAMAWLKDSAEKPEWKKKEQSLRQMNLF